MSLLVIDSIAWNCYDFHVMPRISEFFGIVVLMYWFDQQQHKKPHFHARYSGKEGVFDLDGNLLAGSLGAKGDSLVREWCKLRRSELQTAWDLAVVGKEIPWILPLQ